MVDEILLGGFDKGYEYDAYEYDEPNIDDSTISCQCNDVECNGYCYSCMYR